MDGEEHFMIYITVPTRDKCKFLLGRIRNRPLPGTLLTLQNKILIDVSRKATKRPKYQNLSGLEPGKGEYSRRKAAGVMI